MDNESAYRFDFHVHTDTHVSHPSAQVMHGQIEHFAEQMQVRMAKSKGLVGFALTNHEFSQDIYERVSKLAAPMIVVPAQEVQVAGEDTHILALGVSKDISSGSFDNVIGAIRRQGALAVLAHPFRTKYAVSQFDGVDGVEVWNGSMLVHPDSNLTALAVAESEGPSFIKIGGSDSHFMGGWSAPGRVTTLLSQKPKNWQDLIANIRKYAIGINQPDSRDDTQFWPPAVFHELDLDPDWF